LRRACELFGVPREQFYDIGNPARNYAKHSARQHDIFTLRAKQAGVNYRDNKEEIDMLRRHLEIVRRRTRSI
jgi:hypothetical protein